MDEEQDDKPGRRRTPTRRQLLSGAAGVAAMGAFAAAVPDRADAAGAADGVGPYPIPWLDGNLHHNQVPAPGGPATELSHIFHFKGQVGRAILTGRGTTGDGRTLFVGKGTDYGYMRGVYVTPNGEERLGTFAHL